MRFLHVSDLHIGKRIYNVDLLEDQNCILQQICHMAEAYACDGLLIAGDIYDKAQPSAQAIAAADAFFTQLARQKTAVYLISGNHDNPAQIAYCASILRMGGIYAAEAFDGHLQKIELQDAYGLLDLYLLPFIRPVHVRRFFPDEQIKTYEDAVRTVLENTPLTEERRSVLMAHQYVAGAATCESEELSIGGLEQIPAELLQNFCYTALGHLHSPQALLGGKVRYSGSILKYSFDETTQQKGALLVEIDGKGQIEVEKLPFAPMRDLRVIEGELATLLQLPYSEDYIQVTLTDDVMPLDARGALRINFPNLLHLRIKNAHTGQGKIELQIERAEEKTPLEHFCEFYAAQNNGEAPDAQRLALARQALLEAEEQL